MTRRDIAWRCGGLVLLAGGCAATLHDRGSSLGLIYFAVAILGLVLAVNGKHVAVALKAERRGHPNTASVIHARRRRARGVDAADRER